MHLAANSNYPRTPARVPIRHCDNSAATPYLLSVRKDRGYPVFSASRSPAEDVEGHAVGEDRSGPRSVMGRQRLIDNVKEALGNVASQTRAVSGRAAKPLAGKHLRRVAQRRLRPATDPPPSGLPSSRPSPRRPRRGRQQPPRPAPESQRLRRRPPKPPAARRPRRRRQQPPRPAPGKPPQRRRRPKHPAGRKPRPGRPRPRLSRRRLLPRNPIRSNESHPAR